MLHLGPQPPPSGQEGWPRGRLFTSSWGSVRGLYWFAVREVASLAAPSLCVLALNAAQRQLRGLPLTLSSGRFAVVSILLLQLLVRGFASLLVLPAQREVLAWVEYLARAEWLPQAVRNALRGPRDALMERSLNVDRAKLALSERHRGRDADGAEPVRICAPDGTLLQAWWAPAPPAAGKAVRAVVYLCGNGESAEGALCPPPLGAGMARRWREHGFSVLGVNYRGVSTSGGVASRHGLVLDAVGALAFLTAPAERGGEGLPPHAVALLGHSLGGGVAPEAAAFFPGVTVISDRSFSRLSAAAGGLFLLDAPPWARALLRFVMARFACWEYDAIRHWRALPPETPKIVAFEPADEVIRGPAQLHSELRGKGFVPAPPAAREEVGAVCALESLRFPHNRPFTDGEMARLATVMNAVMREPQVGSSGGLWRPGLPAAF